MHVVLVLIEQKLACWYFRLKKSFVYDIFPRLRKYYWKIAKVEWWNDYFVMIKKTTLIP